MITCGNGLQQLDLVLPRPARVGDHRVQLDQGLLDQLQPPQHRAGQPGMVDIEMSGQRLSQIRVLRRIFPLARLARVSGLVSPSIIAVSIARADTVFRLDATEDNLMEASVRHEALLFEWR
jgi:hypothetical protein